MDTLRCPLSGLLLWARVYHYGIGTEGRLVWSYWELEPRAEDYEPGGEADERWLVAATRTA